MEKQKDKSRYTESFHLNKYVKIALQYVKVNEKICAFKCHIKS